jgi:hypothetical protein
VDDFERYDGRLMKTYNNDFIDVHYMLQLESSRKVVVFPWTALRQGTWEMTTRAQGAMPSRSATNGPHEQENGEDDEASQHRGEGVEEVRDLKWWEVVGIVVVFLVIWAAHAEKDNMARGRR